MDPVQADIEREKIKVDRDATRMEKITAEMEIEEEHIRAASREEVARIRADAKKRGERKVEYYSGIIGDIDIPMTEERFRNAHPGVPLPTPLTDEDISTMGKVGKATLDVRKKQKDLLEKAIDKRSKRDLDVVMKNIAIVVEKGLMDADQGRYLINNARVNIAELQSREGKSDEFIWAQFEEDQPREAWYGAKKGDPVLIKEVQAAITRGRQGVLREGPPPDPREDTIKSMITEGLTTNMPPANVVQQIAVVAENMYPTMTIDQRLELVRKLYNDMMETAGMGVPNP
jgi:hypothetical protein